MADFKTLKSDFREFLAVAYTNPPVPDTLEYLRLEAAWMGGALCACELAVSGKLSSAIVELAATDLDSRSGQLVWKTQGVYDA